MGKRVNYEIVGEAGGVGVVLYVNNSDDGMDPDLIFKMALTEGRRTLSEIVVGLLSHRYPENARNRPNQPIFTIDVEPGDREYVLRATFKYLFEGVPTRPPVFEKIEPEASMRHANLP